ncbi:hypothetical protein HDU83_000399 [Entophlyctis luteolus]|nr:hypothetical protein HDU83_000399 [Entophlyctis luteolus]
MVFGARTTASEVASALKGRISGKHFVITGGNSGIGKEAARALAKEGGAITICCRSVEKAEAARQEILQETPEAEINLVSLDLNSLKSVRACAESLIKSGKPINALINNAGVMACPNITTEDGLESQFQANYLGPYLLTTLLIPTLHSSGTPQDPSRVVNVSSAANILVGPPSGVFFGDLDAKKSYNEWTRYGASKLAQISSTADLQKQYAGKKNVAFVSLHPGVIPGSNLTQYLGIFSIFSALWAFNWLAFLSFLGEFPKSVGQGAATTLVCALDPAVEFGKYYSDCQLSNAVHRLAFDADFAEALKSTSDELIGPYLQ